MGKGKITLHPFQYVHSGDMCYEKGVGRGGGDENLTQRHAETIAAVWVRSVGQSKG